MGICNICMLLNTFYCQKYCQVTDTFLPIPGPCLPLYSIRLADDNVGWRCLLHTTWKNILVFLLFDAKIPMPKISQFADWVKNMSPGS